MSCILIKIPNWILTENNYLNQDDLHELDVLQTAIPTGMFSYFFVATLLCHFLLNRNEMALGIQKVYLEKEHMTFLTCRLTYHQEIKQRDENYVLQLLP